MGVPFFVWDGVSSRDMGLIIRRNPSIVRARERVETIEIPGRSGYLTLSAGANVFDNVVKTVEAQIPPSVDPQAVMTWLRGSGLVVFSTEPDFAYDARIINQIEMERVFDDAWTGTITFLCQPEKRATIPESDISITDYQQVVYNPGNVPSRPKIQIEQQDLLAENPFVRVTVGYKVFEAATDGNGCIIDSDAQIVTDLTGEVDTTYSSTGDFPILEPGDNVVTIQGLPGLTVRKLTPRWRWV